MNNQKGFSHLIIIFAVALLLLVVEIFYKFGNPLAHKPNTPKDKETTMNISCQIDSDCTLKRVGCSNSCSEVLGCVNKNTIPIICLNKKGPCLTYEPQNPKYCFCQDGICVGEEERLSALVKEDLDQALDFCSQYLVGMSAPEDKVGNCKAKLAKLLVSDDCEKAIELCKESGGYCGHELAQSFAKKGYKEDALAICHQYKYQKELCYEYIAFEITKYDYDYALSICDNLKGSAYFKECIINVEEFKTNQ